MDAIFEALMQRAREAYDHIMPIRGEDFKAGCVCDEGIAQFWFNTPDHSTHLVTARLAGMAS